MNSIRMLLMNAMVYSHVNAIVECCNNIIACECYIIACECYQLNAIEIGCECYCDSPSGLSQCT